MSKQKKTGLVYFKNELIKEFEKYEEEAFSRCIGSHDQNELAKTDWEDLIHIFFYNGYLLGITDMAQKQGLHDIAMQMEEQIKKQNIHHGKEETTI